MHRRLIKKQKPFEGLTFDTRYFEYKKKLEEYRLSLTYTSCPMKQALTDARIEEMRLSDKEMCAIPDQNIDRLFRACDALNIPRIFIGKCELVGADDVKQPDGSWPAMWLLKDILDNEKDKEHRFGGGCGNGDQSQTTNTEYFIPEDYIDKAWDVKTRKEISAEPFKARMVVSRIIKNRV